MIVKWLLVMKNINFSGNVGDEIWTCVWGLVILSVESKQVRDKPKCLQSRCNYFATYEKSHYFYLSTDFIYQIVYKLTLPVTKWFLG
jgi:hypothetical protein